MMGINLLNAWCADIHLEGSLQIIFLRRSLAEEDTDLKAEVRNLRLALKTTLKICVAESP